MIPCYLDIRSVSKDPSQKNLLGWVIFNPTHTPDISYLII
ncbi:unnamed protein product [Arabidopsis halleri]